MPRVTATLDDEVLAQIRRLVGPHGVSGFLNLASRERLARLAILGLLDELDAKRGPPPQAVKAAVARDARRIFRR